MKRALVLGASALLILAFNPNTLREVGPARSSAPHRAVLGSLPPPAEEPALMLRCLLQMDLSQVLTKPVVVIQTSENVPKLLGALLRYGDALGNAQAPPLRHGG